SRLVRFVIRPSFSTVFAVALFSTPAGAMAQNAFAVRDSSPFRALELPAPNRVRNGAGRPGAAYWQQNASYRIRATLDPQKNDPRGQETIHYVNPSPDRLPYLWLFLEQNICAPNSITNLLDQPPLVFLNTAFDFSCQGFAGGGHLEYVRILGKDVPRTVFG